MAKTQDGVILGRAKVRQVLKSSKCGNSAWRLLESVDEVIKAERVWSRGFKQGQEEPHPTSSPTGKIQPPLQGASEVAASLGDRVSVREVKGALRGEVGAKEDFAGD